MTGISQTNQPQRNQHPVLAAVDQASRQTGVDFDYLIDVARVESAFNPSAQARTSSARGLYQFTNQTWLATLERHGDAQGYGWAAAAIERSPNGRFKVADPQLRDQVLQLRDDPTAAARMAAKLTADNRAALVDQTGQQPENVDLYLAHFLGVAGAANFLKSWQEDPHQSAAPLMPAAATANRAVFYSQAGEPRTLDQIRERFRAKLGDSNAPAFSTAARLALQSPRKAAGWAIQHDSSPQRQPLELLAMKPMPGKLSLAFAADAYRRLASGGQV